MVLQVLKSVAIRESASCGGVSRLINSSNLRLKAALAAMTFTVVGCGSSVSGSNAASPDKAGVYFSGGSAELVAASPVELLKHEFELRNSGVSAVEFKPRSSCGCTQLKPLEGVLEAGCSVPVVATIRSPEDWGGFSAVHIWSERPDGSRMATCRVDCRVPRVVRVRPRTVQHKVLVGPTVHADSVEKSLSVEAERTGLLLDAEVVGLDFDASILSAWVVGSGRTATVVTSPADGLDVGTHLSTLSLRINQPDGETAVVPLPVEVRVERPWTAVPSRVLLRPSPSGRLTGTLVVRSHDRRTFEVAGFVGDAEGLEITEAEGPRVEGMRFLTVSVGPSLSREVSASIEVRGPDGGSGEIEVSLAPNAAEVRAGS